MAMQRHVVGSVGEYQLPEGKVPQTVVYIRDTDRTVFLFWDKLTIEQWPGATAKFSGVCLDSAQTSLDLRKEVRQLWPQASVITVFEH